MTLYYCPNIECCYEEPLEKEAQTFLMKLLARAKRSFLGSWSSMDCDPSGDMPLKSTF
jgi:hypothetical protein